MVIDKKAVSPSILSQHLLRNDFVEQGSLPKTDRFQAETGRLRGGLQGRVLSTDSILVVFHLQAPHFLIIVHEG